MKRMLLVLIIALTGILPAQEKDSTISNWENSLITGLNISQVSFKDWSKGGDNSLAWTIRGDYKNIYKSDNWVLKNQLIGEYGRTKLGETDFRTTDNDLYLETVLSLNVGWSVDPFFSNMVRTTITEGFNYKEDPAQKTADFFDPGYVIQSLGFTYDRIENFTTRMGLAFKETFTKNYRHYSDDPDTEDELESFKLETGFESVTSAKVNLAVNVDLATKLRLFTRFENIDVWDVRWENRIVAKVNSWLNVTFDYILLYEKAQSLRTQMKEALQVGISYRLI